MRLEKEPKGKCELGRCNKKVAHSIKTDRVGIKSKIYICDECIKELYKVLAEFLVPKSIETIKKREDFSVRKNSLFRYSEE